MFVYNSNNTLLIHVHVHVLCVHVYVYVHVLELGNNSTCTCIVLVSLIYSIDIKRFSCGRVRTKLETQLNYPKTLSVLPEIAADKGAYTTYIIFSVKHKIFGIC